MKIGDLVELSAYGNKLRDYEHCHGKVGLVISRSHPSGWWEVQWIHSPLTKLVHPRKDLKIAKAKR